MQSIKAKASSLLARRSYFSKELKTKLLEKGYPQDEIKNLLAELTKRGWLNDQELAKRYCERLQQRGYGPRLITLKLREKAGSLDIEPLEESEEAVLSLIRKRYMPIQRDKVFRALLRRGFSFELINKALARICEES